MNATEYTLEFEKPLRELESQLRRLQEMSEERRMDVSSEIQAIEAKLEKTKREVYSGLSPWQRVQLARHPRRPTALDYVQELFTGFEELHGDRAYKDDPAIVGGPAWFEEERLMVIGQQKGRDTKGNLRRNFGCPHPEGYRKALRLMRMAENFRLPVLTLIDTPGAFPGVGAEERHVAEAIAVNVREMSRLRVPIVSVVIGEGGSGGALGLAVADRILILENAYYSVISPEGCAAILWKDRAHAPDAAEALRLDSASLRQHGVAEEVLPEPFGGAQADPEWTIRQVAKAVRKAFLELSHLPTGELLEQRYQRFRQLGVYGT